MAKRNLLYKLGKEARKGGKRRNNMAFVFYLLREQGKPNFVFQTKLKLHIITRRHSTSAGLSNLNCVKSTRQLDSELKRNGWSSSEKRHWNIVKKRIKKKQCWD